MSSWYNEEESWQFFAMFEMKPEYQNISKFVSMVAQTSATFVKIGMFKTVCQCVSMSARTNYSCGSVVLWFILCLTKPRYLLHFYKPGHQAFKFPLSFKQYVRHYSSPAGNGRELVSYFRKMVVTHSSQTCWQWDFSS